mgnify:FL=1
MYHHVLHPHAHNKPGVNTHPTYGVPTITTRNARTLPPTLEPYRRKEHSYEAFIETLINTTTTHANTGNGVTLTGTQQEAVDAIVNAHHDKLPGFALSYPTGSGKTPMTIATVNTLKLDTVLVIAPKRAINQWQRELDRFATGTTQWVVINPERMHALFTLNGPTPLFQLPADDRPHTALTHGAPLAMFDMVVTDESHVFANATAVRTRLWQKLVGWDTTGKQPDSFLLNLSATPWSEPKQTIHSAPMIAHALNVPTPDTYTTETDYLSWLKSVLSLKHRLTRYWEWSWEINHSDIDTLTRILYHSGMGAVSTREDIGLGVQERSLNRIALSDHDRARTAQLWRDFLAENDPDRLLDTVVHETAVGKLQQIGMIKAPYVARIVVDYVQAGYQVIVPAWYHVTVNKLVEEIENLAQRVIGPSPTMYVQPVTGLDSDASQRVKIAGFQSGKFPVIVTSTTQSINLHAGEVGGGINGEDATDTPRITVFGDILTGGKRAFQAEGRASRHGVKAPVVYTTALDTAEERALARVFRRLTNTRSLSNTDLDAVTRDVDVVSFLDLADILDPDGTPEATRQNLHA